VIIGVVVVIDCCGCDDDDDDDDDGGGGGGAIVGDALESCDEEEVGDDKIDDVNEDAELVAPSLAIIPPVFKVDVTVDESAADMLQDEGEVLLFFNFSAYFPTLLAL
jgi:hypothetical protein